MVLVGTKVCRMQNSLITIVIKASIKMSPFRGFSYADNRRRDLEFAVGDYVYLKVSPIRGLRRFKVKGKLAPRYIGPFKIIDRKGEVAYQLELPDRLSGVHDVFHVSQLKKCLRVPEEQLQQDELNVRDDLTYTEYPSPNFGNGREDYRNVVIKMCKVKCRLSSAPPACVLVDEVMADPTGSIAYPNPTFSTATGVGRPTESEEEDPEELVPEPSEDEPEEEPAGRTLEVQPPVPSSAPRQSNLRRIRKAPPLTLKTQNKIQRMETHPHRTMMRTTMKPDPWSPLPTAGSTTRCPFLGC
ncbi:hypothetical protein U9M48_032599 [Paspalum notatum var. saurae]|uniref:Tf2-1-like SH3-like domain-containing protein n=1 Tax=Paspalum notatum var. saurae TaxID=547442 RepID=A0AAQ3X4P6_PASNO